MVELFFTWDKFSTEIVSFSDQYQNKIWFKLHGGGGDSRSINTTFLGLQVSYPDNTFLQEILNFT